MIQELRASSDAGTDSPTVWGLTPRELHDAYWRARGVQIVRCGEEQELQSAAEILLLIEPDQLVAFDLSGDLGERLTWHDAAVTRLRLSAGASESYSEHVVIDDDGLVERIERRYSSPRSASHRVALTRHRRLARAWMSAGTPREAWDRVRRAVPWSRVDHAKITGLVFREGYVDQERSFIDTLVERWPLVSQSIDGLEEAGPGVWHVAGQGLEPGVVRVGPCWVGIGRAERGRACIIGPAWTPDVASREPGGRAPVTLRPIEEVELADAAPRRRPPVRRTAYAIVKRTLDVVASFLGLIALSPVIAMLAFLVWKEDHGPIFFRHRRQGRNGRPFECLKFRTMMPNALAFARELEDRNLADGPQVYILDDPRVTKVGRKLRQYHLDELPQLWNVLVGNMSLVGPRPSPDNENQYCPAWRDMRLSVRPGITGLWQLERTRNPGEDFQEWIKYDIEYVQSAGLWLDVAILVRTMWALLPGRSHRASK